MAKVQPAFTAKFRVVDNNSDRENAPEKNMILDFTVEEAMKAATFLVKKCEEAGFSLWGGMWGNSGRLQPLPPQNLSQSNTGSGGQMIDVDDLPF